MFRIVRANDIITVKNNDFCAYTREVNKKGWHLEQTNCELYKKNENDIVFLLCYWK